MRKVLIVDDDDDLLNGQKLFLEQKGYIVQTASSMEDGLKKLGGFLPDVIIADLMMEHYDTGLVFCKRIRNNPELRDVPIIMQTAAPKHTGFSIDPSDPAVRPWIKVDEVLTKPVSLEKLVEKIEKWLGRKSGDE